MYSKATSLFGFALCFILHVHISAIFCSLSCACSPHTSCISAAKVCVFHSSFPLLSSARVLVIIREPSTLRRYCSRDTHLLLFYLYHYIFVPNSVVAKAKISHCTESDHFIECPQTALRCTYRASRFNLGRSRAEYCRAGGVTSCCAAVRVAEGRHEERRNVPPPRDGRVPSGQNGRKLISK